MRGIAFPKDTKRAYTIASDALIEILNHAASLKDNAERYRLQSLCYGALADILDMVDDDDPEQIQRDLQWESKEELRETVGDDVRIRLSSVSSTVQNVLDTPPVKIGLYESANRSNVNEVHHDAIENPEPELFKSSYVFAPEDGKRIEHRYD